MPHAVLPPTPVVGRSQELASLSAALDAAKGGHGTLVFIAGEGGIGKTRLVEAAGEQARARGFAVALGRAYAVETGVPFALFADALLPTLRALDNAAIAAVTRGLAADLARLFPVLSVAIGMPRPDVARGDPAEVKARLFWSFSQLLARLAGRAPLLLALENLQWADASSLELLHFVARQFGRERLLLLASYNAAERDANPTLAATERSLVSLGAASVMPLAGLEEADVRELLLRTFGAPATATREFARRLHERTRGNAFFIEETLKALIAAGALREEHGRWVGWDREAFELPTSVRDAIVARLARLSKPARSLAETLAALGTRAGLDLIEGVADVPRDEVLEAVDELRRERVIGETGGNGAAEYDFSHPFLREVTYAELGAARARGMHERLAEALERYYGPAAPEHADELALHFARAGAPRLAARAVGHLAAAGRSALVRHADREAVGYLVAALHEAERAPGTLEEPERERLIEELARGRQRLGEHEQATALWRELRERAARAGRAARVAAVDRRLGLITYWGGRPEEAVAYFDDAIAGAEATGDEDLLVRASIARGVCLIEVGRRDAAEQDLQRALAAAERVGKPPLRARAYRALVLLYAWTGPSERAREYGARAITLARESENRQLEATVHWALAMLGGLTGNSREVATHLGEAVRLADELQSPLLRVWAAEIEIEFAAATGDWDAAIAVGERTIALARALGQRALLPRVLVWCALVHMGRGDIEHGGALVREAADIVAEGGRRRGDLHLQVPVQVGQVAYAVARKDYALALQLGDEALRVVERTGYVVWAIHRLLPLVAEAALWAMAYDRARELGARLRQESEKLGHELGLAWADACDALVRLFSRDAEGAISLLAAAVDRLEAVPFVPDAARLRRLLARAFVETGDREAAARELRKAHDVFTRLGARTELERTREQLRELGARPPALVAAKGAEGLTGRELEIVRLVVARRSNKEIGTVLGISPRTVSTHLSNIFEKLGVASRGELADFAREQLIVAR